MSAMDSLTAVIPTFNREALLRKALEGYLAQSAVQSICEVLVVDDGSTDGTESVVSEIGQKSPVYSCGQVVRSDGTNWAAHPTPTQLDAGTSRTKMLVPRAAAHAVVSGTGGLTGCY